MQSPSQSEQKAEMTGMEEATSLKAEARMGRED